MTDGCTCTYAVVVVIVVIVIFVCCITLQSSFEVFSYCRFRR